MRQRRIILSRKGFDSKNGGIPSPILPDGTILSLPIPWEKESLSYEDLHYDGTSYAEIMRQLNYRQNVNVCHIDPDLRVGTLRRSSDWRACLGQSEIAASHLQSNCVDVGDIFLFFGWFRRTEHNTESKLKFIRGESDIHAVFGYLQVGEIAKTLEERAKFHWHPHSIEENYNEGLNHIYVASERLLDTSLPGFGTFKFDKKLQLSKEGLTRSRWQLPDCLLNIEMTYHTKNSHKLNYFQSAMIGQEFVFNSNYDIEYWIKSLANQFRD